MDKHREMKKILRLSCWGILINFFSYGFEIFYLISCTLKYIIFYTNTNIPVAYIQLSVLEHRCPFRQAFHRGPILPRYQAFVYQLCKRAVLSFHSRKDRGGRICKKIIFCYFIELFNTIAPSSILHVWTIQLIIYLIMFKCVCLNVYVIYRKLFTYLSIMIYTVMS